MNTYIQLRSIAFVQNNEISAYNLSTQNIVVHPEYENIKEALFIIVFYS